MRLTDRDIEIMRLVGRWGFCLGRSLKELACFGTLRATDRRLRLLVDNEFLYREKILYGVPYIYTLAPKSQRLLNMTVRKQKVKIEQIYHDIAVLDTAIYFVKKHGIDLKDIRTEKELHMIDGFSNRHHRPDFIFYRDEETHCIEVELTAKAKARQEKNLSNNFMNYDKQIWVVPQGGLKIRKILEENKNVYPNIDILDLQEVKDYVKSL